MCHIKQNGGDNLLTRVEALRVNVDKKQEEVAIDLGLSKAQYSRIERGAVKIDIQDVLKICDYFNVDNPRDIEWYPKKSD